MFGLKGIKLYFFCFFKLIFSNILISYYKSIFYNKKITTSIPSRIFYSPSSHLIAPLTTINNDIYKISNIPTEKVWEKKYDNTSQFKNLHSFLWLTKLDRKSSKIFSQKIINQWIKNNNNFSPEIWEVEILAKRIIAWISNTDITLQDSEKNYKEKFFESLIKQYNHLLRNTKRLPYSSKKIICCSAIILSGLTFKETIPNFKYGVKELEKIIENYFDKNGFVKSRNPEEVYTSLKFLILIREWFKEAQESIPEFLDQIIYKCGNCYNFLSNSHKRFPLFNGASEFDYSGYDIFLKNQKYKFSNKNNENGGLVKIKKEKLEFFIDIGNPPSNKFSNKYQAGCLSFELISNGEKIICNSGYKANMRSSLSLISSSTAAHSTLYINNISSCIFQKNKLIRKVYGNSLIKKHKILSKTLKENKEFSEVSASHNGYEKRNGYVHQRSVKVYNNKIEGLDELKRKKNYGKSENYYLRFHIYPGIKIAKTKTGRSILLSLSNKEGWKIKSSTNNFEIEKSFFLGNKNKIIENESILISGIAKEELCSINWTIEKIT